MCRFSEDIITVFGCNLLLDLDAERQLISNIRKAYKCSIKDLNSGMVMELNKHYNPPTLFYDNLYL